MTIRIKTLLLTLFCVCSLHAQSVLSILDDNRKNIQNGKYETALAVLDNIHEESLIELGDSCVMLYNYEKGMCLYYLDKVENAIPFLQIGLEALERLPHEDCNYLELIYRIGSCYNNIEQYENAEKYFRRVMIRGNAQDFNCIVTVRALSELVEVYNRLGRPDLANACTERIEKNYNSNIKNDWDIQVELLFNLGEAQKLQKEKDSFIETYNKILQMVEENEGEESEDYLTYLYIYGLSLVDSFNLQLEALPIFERLLEIGRTGNYYRDFVCLAYENILRIKSSINDVEGVESILPQAINSFNETKDDIKTNIYEMIGSNFYEAGNLDVGAKYLEKEWNGETANTIHALSCLLDYYYFTDPQKALYYGKKGVAQFGQVEEVDDLTKRFFYTHLMYLSYNGMNYAETIQYAELLMPLINVQDNTDDYASLINHYTGSLIMLKEYKKAISIFIKNEDIEERIKPEDLLLLYADKGFAFVQIEDYYNSIEPLKKAAEIAIKTNQENWLITIYHNLGTAYMKTSNYTEALEYLNLSKNLQLRINGVVMQRTEDYINECLQKQN